MGKRRALGLMLRGPDFFLSERKRNNDGARISVSSPRHNVHGGVPVASSRQQEDTIAAGGGVSAVISPQHEATIIAGTGAAAVVVSLPEDIVSDVLARLPVKTLCRFRCVSKRWRALISDPAFAAAQRSSHAAAPLVVGVFGSPRPLDKFRQPRPPRFPPTTLTTPWPELRLVDSADGSVLRLVEDVKSAKLMRARLDLVLVDQGVHGARVIDPATGRAAMIGGEAAAEYPRARYNGTSYISNLHKWLCHSSLGRATPSGANKVVRLRDALSAGNYIQICQIATVGDGEDGDSTASVEQRRQPPATWRQRPEPPILTCCCSGCTATANGVIYFLDLGAPAHGTRLGTPPPGSWNRIAAFDLESEEWKATIHGPPMGLGCPDPPGERWEMTLVELKGTLGVLQTVRPCGYYDHYANVWLLVDPEKSTWTKECTIQMDKSWCLLRVLDILGDGRVLLLNAFKEQQKSLEDARCVLQLYHPNTGSRTDLLEMSENFRGPMVLYTGNLLSSS